MIASRVCPSPTRPSALNQVPESSGPRWRMRATMASRRSPETGRETDKMPAMPHMVSFFRMRDALGLTIRHDRFQRDVGGSSAEADQEQHGEVGFSPFARAVNDPLGSHNRKERQQRNEESRRTHL